MLMIVHEITQGSSLPETLQISETGHLPPVWLAAAAIGVSIGVAILFFACSSTRANGEADADSAEET